MPVTRLSYVCLVDLMSCMALLLAATGCAPAPGEAQKQQPTSASQAPARTAEVEPATGKVTPGDAAAGATAAAPVSEVKGGGGAAETTRPLEAAPVGAPSASQQPPALPSSAAVEPAKPLDDKSFRWNPLRQGEMPAEESSPAPPPAVAATAAPPVQHAASSVTEPSSEPAKKAFGKGKHSGIKFDPVKGNEIFPVQKDGKTLDGWPPYSNKPGAGWPQPALALVVSGRQDGYLEPCGCAGLDRMKGGLSRRDTFVQGLRQAGWPIVLMDVGGLSKGFGRQAEMKFETTVEALRKMGYGAIAFGKNDLQLPAAELVAFAAGVNNQESPFVAANVGLFGFESGIPSRTHILQAGTKKVGVTAVLGKEFQKEVQNTEVSLSDPQEALRKVLPELKGKADLLVLLANATKEESDELAKQFPDFKVVVTAGGFSEPPRDFEKVKGTETIRLEVGEKGANVVVLGFFDDPANPVRYQRVPLDSRFSSSQDVLQLMGIYQNRLQQEGLEGLGIREVPHPQKDVLGDFVGSEKCGSCHDKSYAVWKKSGHAKAWATLVNANPPRNSDPECISCHVVGWNSNRYFPYQSGFLSEAKTPQLVNVGCESCHGPGGRHVSAEMGSDQALQQKLQKAMVITKEESEKRQCVTCHDLDNSPDFEFKDYWPQVEHYEAK